MGSASREKFGSKRRNRLHEPEENHISVRLECAYKLHIASMVWQLINSLHFRDVCEVVSANREYLTFSHFAIVVQ